MSKKAKKGVGGVGKGHGAQSPWEREMMAAMAKKAAAKPALAASRAGAKSGGGGSSSSHNTTAQKKQAGPRGPPLRGHVVDERGVDPEEFERDMELAARRKNTKLYNRLITKYAKLHAADKSQALFDQVIVALSQDGRADESCVHEKLVRGASRPCLSDSDCV
jgi:hypothetical protein